MKPFSQQAVVVTGAGSGLGRAITLHLSTQAGRTIALDIDGDRLGQLAGEGERRVETAVCDVTNLADVERTLGGLEVDALVNAAGITGKTGMKCWDVDPVDLERVFRINVFGCFNTSKVVLPGMVARGYGRILHIASISGKEGNAGMLAYSSSKAAVIGMTKVQGKELAGTGVTVNALAPAVIWTPLIEALPPEQIKYMTDKIPMGRCGTLEEVAAMVEFIISPQNSFTTAFTFDLSGGRATY